MQKVEPMSIHERLQMRMKAFELEEQGKFEEAEKVAKQIPMSPWLAKFAKKHFGLDYLIEHGWNLSEAEAEFGSDWISR